MRFTGRAIFFPSVVIHNLDVDRACVGLHKADSPLNVDPNAVLSLSVTLQRFQVIARGRLHEIQRLSRIQLGELSFCHRQKRFEPARTFALVKRQSVFALERLDHDGSLLRAA
jgi:hypothetical protein